MVFCSKDKGCAENPNEERFDDCDNDCVFGCSRMSRSKLIGNSNTGNQSKFIIHEPRRITDI
jgi:hypothetical protein